MTEHAFLGGGCFWCLEAVFQRVKGVRSVTSGYMGGHVDQPTYDAVCGGRTGHAEVVHLTFDPSETSYEAILDLFFLIHDPTTPNQQGNDVGPQYRSIIFAVGSDQAAAAALACQAYAQSHPAADPVVTEIVTISEANWQGHGALAHRFFSAEAHHQNYFQTHPNQGYCAFVVAPKVIKAERERPALMHAAP
ncbi:MAG: peptide-methionine (S)-S-oxide reductase MsrA [Burkholderiaceae bacterium]